MKRLIYFRQYLNKIRILSGIKTQRYLAGLTMGQLVLVTSLLVTSGMLGLRQLGLLESLELGVFDQMVGAQPDKGADPRLLIVGITDADIQALHQWPITDQTIVQTLINLQAYQPKVIGLDLHRDISQGTGRELLLSQLRGPNLIIVTKLEDRENPQTPPPPGVPPQQVGFSDVVLDGDGVIRRNFMYAQDKKEHFYSLALRLSLFYLQDRGITLQVKPNRLQVGSAAFIPLEANSGGYRDIDSAGYQVLLTYRSHKQVARQVQLLDVLNHKLRPEWVKDKIVLIGLTAPSAKDMFFTPYDRQKQDQPQTPGVFLHAYFTSQILSTVLDHQPLFWFWPKWVEALWVWLWCFLAGVAAWQLRLIALGFVTIAALFSLWGSCFIFFLGAGWIPLIPAALGLVIAVIVVTTSKLIRNTFHDPLTGLPNREMFLHYVDWTIAEAKLSPSPLFAILFLELDRFTAINDSLGPRYGDRLLGEIVQRFQNGLPRPSLVARVGGDEFAILLGNLKQSQDATEVADQLRQRLALPFSVEKAQLFITASIGISLSQLDYEYQSEHLLRDAHTALYRAKALGKSRYEVFATGMRTQIVKHLQLETGLYQALERQELELYYQPIVNLETRKIVGFEALLRWNHAHLGMISPGEFIPIAEETMLIIPIGKWILKTACEQLKTWQGLFPHHEPIMMSVNLSTQQFSQPDLVSYIEQILKNCNLDGHCLKLEITESMAMKDVEVTIDILMKFKRLKLQISIDDFGIGYSSLSYLQRFPIDTLKIDRSFISRMEVAASDAVIVEAILILGHKLGMDIIAEGLETATQVDRLQALGCEYGQGFFFSKPVNKTMATQLLGLPN